jgi:site-specific DNA-methyltransferase (adenine-specific)
MKNLDVMYSSKSDEWSTPQKFFDEINSEFNFDLDAAASELNHKCSRYFTAADDGLTQKWGGVEYFAIHHIHRLINGLQKHFMKPNKKIHL